MIGKIIRMYRRQHDLTQQYMAFCLDISQNAYSRIELDQTELTLNRLVEISRILDVPVITLLHPILNN